MSLYKRGETATLYATFLKANGNDNPIVLNPVITIKHFDGTQIVTDVLNEPLIQDGGSNQYYYNYNIPTDAYIGDYIAIFNANIDGTDVESSDNFRILNNLTNTETVSSNILFVNSNNLEILKGTSKLLEFKLKDENLNPIDLTGLSGKFQLIKNNSNGTTDILIDKTLNITDATNGFCEVLLNNTDTNIDVNDYDYILLFNYGIDDDRILGKGTVSILGNQNSRIDEIRNRYGLDFDDYVIENALNYVRQYLLDYVYDECEINFNEKKQNIEIENYVADSNFDGVIDINDITIQEYTTKAPYIINDLNSHVTNTTLNYPTGKSYITLDAEYPSSDDRKLVLKYYRSCFDVQKNKTHFDRLEEYLIFIYLFENLNINKLQRGILTRDINGVSITYDVNAINDMITKLKNDLNLIMYRLKGGVCMNVGCGTKNTTGFRNVWIGKRY